MTTQFGDFGCKGYLSEGDPYVKKGSLQDSRHKGVNFKATVGRQGKTNDATFSKFTSVHAGDVYIDPLKRMRALDGGKAAATAKNVSSGAWKPASPMKKSAPQAGDDFGTLGGKIPYEMIHCERHLKKGDVKGTPRGMYTAPVRQGGYGFNKTTLSERKGAKGIMGEYEYIHDPYDKRMRKENKDVAPMPFKPPRLFSAKPVFAEYDHVPVGAPVPLPSYGKKLEGAPFRPVYSKGAALGRYPEHVPCPDTPPQRKAPAEDDKASRAAWRPSMGYRSTVTPSIIRMNV